MTGSVPATIVARAEASGIALTIGSSELLDALEPLWLALFDHHAEVGAAGLPVIDRALSWPRRRRLYAELLAGPEAAIVIARRDSAAVGYCLVHVHHGADDTWPTGELIGEVESLAVITAERGHGLGTLLLDAAEAHLASVGALDVLIGVLAGNDDAQRFYERRGMVPAVIKMLRLGPAPQA